MYSHLFDRLFFQRISFVFKENKLKNLYTFDSYYFFLKYSYEGRFPSVSLSFEWNIYQLVELDELILVVCFIFSNRVSFVQNMTQNIRTSTYYDQRRSILEAKNHSAGTSECRKYNSYWVCVPRTVLNKQSDRGKITHLKKYFLDQCSGIRSKIGGSKIDFLG